jgi:hypothetical protein
MPRKEETPQPFLSLTSTTTTTAALDNTITPSFANRKPNLNINFSGNKVHSKT